MARLRSRCDRETPSRTSGAGVRAEQERGSLGLRWQAQPLCLPEASRRLATSHLVDVLDLAAGAVTLVLWAARTGQSQSVQAYIVGGGSGVALFGAVQALGLARVMRGRPGG